MRKARFLLLALVASVGCSGCSLAESRDIGPYKTPIHAYGFVSCAGNSPIDWIRGDAAADIVLRTATLAHEAQHVLDFTRLGGCSTAYSAYVANPLWFESRAYCAGARALAERRLAPPVEDQLDHLARGLASQLSISYAAAFAALQEACFVRIYGTAP